MYINKYLYIIFFCGCARAVNGADLKSAGLSPHEFESRHPLFILII